MCRTFLTVCFKLLISGPGVWSEVASCLGARKLGRKSPITDNDYRSPRVEMLLGQDGWVTHVDNGVK